MILKYVLWSALQSLVAVEERMLVSAHFLKVSLLFFIILYGAPTLKTSVAKMLLIFQVPI